MEEIKKDEVSIENQSIEKLEKKVLDIAEDIQVISKLLSIILIIEIFIFVFYLLEMQAI
jgi:hypothetical protein